MQSSLPHRSTFSDQTDSLVSLALLRNLASKLLIFLSRLFSLLLLSTTAYLPTDLASSLALHSLLLHSLDNVLSPAQCSYEPIQDLHQLWVLLSFGYLATRLRHKILILSPQAVNGLFEIAFHLSIEATLLCGCDSLIRFLLLNLFFGESLDFESFLLLHDLLDQETQLAVLLLNAVSLAGHGLQLFLGLRDEMLLLFNEVEFSL